MRLYHFDSASLEKGPSLVWHLELCGERCTVGRQRRWSWPYNTVQDPLPAHLASDTNRRDRLEISSRAGRGEQLRCRYSCSVWPVIQQGPKSSTRLPCPIRNVADPILSLGLHPNCERATPLHDSPSRSVKNGRADARPYRPYPGLLHRCSNFSVRAVRWMIHPSRISTALVHAGTDFRVQHDEDLTSMGSRRKG